MKLRATIAHQGQGYAYIPPQEWTRQRPTDLQLRSQIRDECQQWVIPVEPGAVVIVLANDMVEFATLGKSLTVARVATTRMARSAMVGEVAKYTRSEPSPTSFCESLAHS